MAWGGQFPFCLSLKLHFPGAEQKGAMQSCLTPGPPQSLAVPQYRSLVIELFVLNSFLYRTPNWGFLVALIGATDYLLTVYNQPGSYAFL